MALPNDSRVGIDNLEQWFGNLVDTLNYNLQKIIDEVPALDQVLITFDPAPIQDIKNALETLQSSIATRNVATK